MLQGNNDEIQSLFETHIISPQCLLKFQNSSILLMSYGNLGSLIDIIQILSQETFASQEHEIIVLDIAVQVMLQCLSYDID